MGERVGFREVLTTVSDVGAKAEFMAEFKRRGGRLDGWSDRAVREAACNALTYTEDAAELRRMAYEKRVRLRDLRRRLECELWP